MAPRGGRLGDADLTQALEGQAAERRLVAAQRRLLTLRLQKRHHFLSPFQSALPGWGGMRAHGIEPLPTL